jgi:uncharacterized iron-regulated protein
MKKYHYPILVLATLFLSFTGDKPAYVLYSKEGKEVKYDRMIKALEGADIIFFGELHTDPIAHWLQIELTKDLYDSKKDALVLGAEMFEADKFEAEMRLWDNYQTDYKPLVEFAKDHGIPFIATNIPRRYASMVHKKGFESLEGLSKEAKAFIAPLPIRYDPEVSCYKDMLGMMEMPKKAPSPEGEAMPPAKAPAAPSAAAMHGAAAASTMENLPKAQAAKDATMAYFILQNWSKGKTLFHFNGSYHSNNFEGIVWHLLQEKPELKIVTINTVLQENVDTLEEEYLGTADFIVCVPESMTRTKR